MKQIKAYMRQALLGSTFTELEAKGARDITVTNVDAVGNLSDFEMDRWSINSRRGRVARTMIRRFTVRFFIPLL